MLFDYPNCPTSKNEYAFLQTINDKILYFCREEIEGMNTRSREKNRTNLLIPVIIIFCLMVLMVLYTSKTIQDVAIANIHEVGEDRISSVAAQLENYLEMTKSVLWVTADSVDHMVRNGASTQDILQYITVESENQEQHFDENYTGIYGYVTGEYLDGAGWIPPEGYDPVERDWYKAGIETNGEAIIVSPYVDAQTNAVIISISRMLSNGTDVLSLDVMMNHIQDIISDLQIKGKGYGYILNRDGMIIAHRDETQKGKYLNETEEQRSFITKVLEVENGNFEISADGKKSTVFVHQIMDQWYIVIIVSNRELFSEVWQQMAVNVLICVVIFALIAFFYFLGHRKEQNYSRRIEEMRIEEQKKAFEAKTLKLEKEAADQANRAKSDFLADMSHEIRTPINAVLGMNEMILRESLQAQSSEKPGLDSFQGSFGNIITYAQNIESAGSNLLAIINDILDFSKIEAGRMDIVEGNYYLSSILNDLSNMIFFKANEKGLDFIIDVDETLPDGLCGDEVRVRQVITNILNNAVKYTEHGFVKLTMRGDIQDAAEPGQSICLRIDVQDTGIGIRQEDLEKMFAKFQRLDLKQNSTVEGTGLGLAITRSLLDMMGGSIEVKSEYGKGSVFTILIPQKIVSVEPIGDFQTRFLANMKETKAYRETFRAPEAHILIVDDTRMNLTVAVGLLKNTEIQIDTATGGDEAIALAQTNVYDLILMDQRMPKMDGTEALHLIRTQTDGANRETPVICLTADAVIGAKERYIAEGFTDYLTKPIDSHALEQMLMKYLPREKVCPVQKQSQEGAAEPHSEESEDFYAPLRTAGIDPVLGLSYCMNDVTLYRSLLQEYAQSSMEKAQDIERYYDVRDWKNYSVLVHSLKSTSRMIGAAALSEIAARLEAAALECRAHDIEREHASMLSGYNAVSQAIRQVFGIGETDDFADSSLSENEEILEFLPDNSF